MEADHGNNEGGNIHIMDSESSQEVPATLIVRAASPRRRTRQTPRRTCQVKRMYHTQNPALDLAGNRRALSIKVWARRFSQTDAEGAKLVSGWLEAKKHPDKKKPSIRLPSKPKVTETKTKKVKADRA